AGARPARARGPRAAAQLRLTLRGRGPLVEARAHGPGLNGCSHMSKMDGQDASNGSDHIDWSSRPRRHTPTSYSLDRNRRMRSRTAAALDAHTSCVTPFASA